MSYYQVPVAFAKEVLAGARVQHALASSGQCRKTAYRAIIRGLLNALGLD